MTADAPKPRRRSILLRVFIALVLLVFLAIAATGGAVWWAQQRFEQTGPLAADTFVMLDQGDGLNTIAVKLRDAGVISKDDPFKLGLLDDASIFKLGVRYAEMQAKLKAGEYQVPAHASMRQVMELLVAGKVIQYKVTAAEGLTSAMILRVVLADPVLTGDARAAPAEGTLLPETYLFTRGTTRADMLRRMAKAHSDLAEKLWEKRAKDLPYTTLAEAVILASIVEKETGLAEERPQVASVFVNRLRKGMKLQSDPTIIYGLTGGEPLGHGLRRSELDKPNPYNTYQIEGLPPGPISNPGRASLEAVMNPPDTDYLSSSRTAPAAMPSPRRWPSTRRTSPDCARSSANAPKPAMTRKRHDRDQHDRLCAGAGHARHARLDVGAEKRQRQGAGAALPPAAGIGRA